MIFFLRAMLVVSLGAGSSATFAADPLRSYVRTCKGSPPPVEFQHRTDFPFLNELAFLPLEGRFSSPAPHWPVLHWPLKVGVRSSLEQRRLAIADFPLDAIIVKAGHAPVRDPTAVTQLMEKMKTGYILAKTDSDRPKINIRTDGTGNITAVELLEGHHRILALYGLGEKTVAALPQDLDVWVNGIRTDGSVGYAKFPAHSLDFASAPHWQGIHRDYGIPTTTHPEWMTPPSDKTLSHLIEKNIIGLRTDKGELSGELILHHEIANEQVGSRDTLKTAYEALSREYQPRIAIQVVENGKIPSIQEVGKYSEFEEILLVAEGPSPAVVGKVEELNQQLRETNNPLRFNFYQGIPFESYVGVFGRPSFQKRVQQMYKTANPAPILP